MDTLERINQRVEIASMLATCDIKDLSEREQEVLKMRFGIMNGIVNGKTHTLEEVGKKFGVTRERIRQIEAKALKRLKNNPPTK